MFGQGMLRRPGLEFNAYRTLAPQVHALNRLSNASVFFQMTCSGKAVLRLAKACSYYVQGLDAYIPPIMDGNLPLSKKSMTTKIPHQGTIESLAWHSTQPGKAVCRDVAIGRLAQLPLFKTVSNVISFAMMAPEKQDCPHPSVSQLSVSPHHLSRRHAHSLPSWNRHM